MEGDLISKLFDLGTQGVMLVLLILLLFRQGSEKNKDIKKLNDRITELEANHRTERKEWKDTAEKQFEHLERGNMRYSDDVRQHTSILAELKTIIETLRH